MDVDNPPRIIVVTSPKQSDGKSTIAANLAAAIAIGGQPVTLIDGDLRRPTVARLARRSSTAPDSPTSSSAGSRSRTSSRTTPTSPACGCWRPAPSRPNPSELLGSQAMRHLIAELARDAMVIIDAPPLLPVTDAAVLTRSADGAIVVITHGGTLDTELQASLNNISTVHGRTLGIVFNRMRRSASGGYYGDYYRYEYQANHGKRRAQATRQAGLQGRAARRRRSQRHALTPGQGTAARSSDPPTPISSRASAGFIGVRWASAPTATARSTSWAFDSTGTPRLMVRTSSMPTRRWPPLERLASITDRVERPIPVADQLVVSAGRSRTAATSASVVPFMPPGTPITRSTCTLPPAGSP